MIMRAHVAKLLRLQAFRYLLAGGTAFTTEYVCFLLLYGVLHAPLYVANSMSFCAGLVVSFTLNRGWAFKQQSFRLRGHHQAAAYLVLALWNLGLINVFVGIFRHFGIAAAIAKLCAMVLIVMWNFFAFRLFIFAEPKPSS